MGFSSMKKLIWLFAIMRARAKATGNDDGGKDDDTETAAEAQEGPQDGA